MKKRILTIAAVLIATVSAFSQSVTETRQIKTTALQIYENYKVVISELYSRSAYTEDNFMALFDKNAALYNDIIPVNRPERLSPAEYFAKFQGSIRRIYPVYSDFELDEPVSVGNKWQINCYFTRGTRFRTTKDMVYPEWCFNYIMIIEMDKTYHSAGKVYENARIINIDVKNPLHDFFVIENKENIPLTTKTGATVKDWDNEYQSRIFPENRWKISDIRVPESTNNKNIFEYSKNQFSRNQSDAHFYQLAVQRFPKNIFGVGVNYSPFSFGNEMSEDFKHIEHTSSALSFSLFYGKQVFQKRKATGFVKIGLDLNRYSYEYSVAEEIGYSYPAIDAEGDSCLRIININSLNKKVNIVSVSVPLTVQYLYQLTNHAKNPIFLSFELGGFAEYTLSSGSKHILNANRSGIYAINFKDSEEDVSFDHYYDYGNIDVSLKQNFAYGFWGGVGLWLALNNNNLLKFNFSYKHSINPPLEYEENLLISVNEELYPSFLQSTEQGLRNIGFGVSWVRTIGKRNN